MYLWMITPNKCSYGHIAHCVSITAAVDSSFLNNLTHIQSYLFPHYCKKNYTIKQTKQKTQIFFLFLIGKVGAFIKQLFIFTFR